MRIDRIIQESDEPPFSFEFFPPKTEEGEANLFEAIEQLVPLNPAYVSVTYGAGGSTRDKTIEIVSRIRDEYGIEAMAHFTCVEASVDDLRSTLDELRERGVENVLALRGDPPGGGEWTKAEGGLPNLAVISSVAPFIGLFGTVWGIMTSFAGIAQSQDTSLAVVAPGIAEALAATAYGLAAAIPASIGYNRIGASFAKLGQEVAHYIEDEALRMTSGAGAKFRSHKEVA